jgi:hypothetical protein
MQATKPLKTPMQRGEIVAIQTIRGCVKTSRRTGGSGYSLFFELLAESVL